MTYLQKLVYIVVIVKQDRDMSAETVVHCHYLPVPESRTVLRVQIFLFFYLFLFKKIEKWIII